MDEFKIIDFCNIKQNNDICKHKKINYSDDIYTFDIEVTSLFEIENKFKSFDFRRNPKYYQNKIKVALPYIWMFGINNQVIYSRDFYKFNDLLVCLSDKYKRKIIYVHNLSYEFQFLRNIIEKYNYTIENFLTYKKRKIISFLITELNIEFRCSYCLTNLNLDLAAKKYNKKYNKKSGDLNYLLARSPLTPLTEAEINYCEYDILALYEIILYFKNTFKHVAKIPMTQTGIVRNELKRSAPFYHMQKMTKMLPDEKMYFIFNQLFTGGFVHSYYKLTDKIINDVYSMDLTSAYPYSLLAFKYPMTKFFEVKNPDKFKFYNNDNWCKIMLVDFINIKSKKGHSLISTNKIIEYDNITKDNGRVLKADRIRLLINEIDLINIDKIYNYKEIKIYKMWCSKKKVLPKFIIEMILKYYNNKTRLKNVLGKETYYMNDKQKLNSIYGCFCTALIREGLEYTNNDYAEVQGQTLEDKQNCVYNNIFYYPWGAWCTSYTRYLLCNIINKLSDDVIYCDTDSIKFKNKNNLKYFYDDNEIIKNRLIANLKVYNIDINKLEPKDIKGNIHPLGVWECDGKYQKFKTLGAKRYCYLKDNNIYMTVSGLNKRAKIKSMDDFKNGLEFSYKDAQKNISNYNDNQKAFEFYDYLGNKFICDNIKYSLNLQPTTFTLGLTDDYIRLINFINYYVNK